MPRLLASPDAAANLVAGRAAVEAPPSGMTARVPLVGGVVLQELGAGHEAIGQVGLAGADIVTSPRAHQHRGAAPGSAAVLACEVHRLGKLDLVHQRVAQGIAHAGTVLLLQQVHGWSIQCSRNMRTMS